MNSMTGFGHAEASLSNLDVSVDIKSVNGRYFDVKARLSREVQTLESELKAILQKKINRGRIDLFIEVRQRADDQLELNLDLARNYLSLCEQARSLGFSGNFEVSDLLSMPGIVQAKSGSVSEEVLRDSVLSVLRPAVEQLLETREREGRVLKQELTDRIGKLESLVERMEERSGGMLEFYRQKLASRVRELTESRVVDEIRMSQEILFHAERSDITEELTRLRSHIKRFQEYLADSESAPTGKQLDFLCQELNREINTALSKSGLTEISEMAVEAKAEIERIREQVQNVE